MLRSVSETRPGPDIIVSILQTRRKKIGEKDRLRQQKYRAKKQAEAQARAVLAQQMSLPGTGPQTQRRSTRSKTQEEENALQATRAKWAEAKRKQRKTWSGQKKRREREKASQRYYRRKSSSQPQPVGVQGLPPPAPTTPASPRTPQPEGTPPASSGSPMTQSCNKEAERKSLYRAKKAVFKLNTHRFGKLYRFITKKAKSSPRKKKILEDMEAGSPSAKTLKECFVAKLAEMKTKRSKKSSVAKKLLFDIRDGSDIHSLKPPPAYKRKQTASVTAVQQFLENVTIDLPGKKSVSKKTMQQKKVLPKRIKRLLKDFRKVNPQHKVSLATFYRNIPAHIMTAGKQSYRQCLCEYCTNLDLKLDAVNKHMRQAIDGRDSLSEASLCPSPTLACYQRKCDSCGVAFVRRHIEANLTAGQDTFVKWSAWELVHRGKGKRRELVHKEGTLEELIDLILQDLQLFSSHAFISRWQHTQFRTCKAAVSDRPSLALAVCDFAENYLCRYQDEVQSAHWGYNQVTVHPTVTYYRCPNPACSETVTEYLVFLSDDLQHDACMAKTILDKTIGHLKDTVPELTDLRVFSDGCAAQFKSKLPLFHLANASGPLKVQRAYFGSRHGKSPCDACGGVVKRAVDEDVLSGEAIIQSAAAMHAHCREHYTLPVEQPPAGTCSHTRRSFYLISSEEIDRSFSSANLHTLPGTRAIHSVRGLGGDTVQTRNLACFCSSCLDGMNDCENADFVQEWDTYKLKIKTPLSASQPQDSHPACDCEPATDHASDPQPAPEPALDPQSTPEIPLASEADVEPDRPEPVPRLQMPKAIFFRRLYKQITEAKSFAELQALADNNDPADYPLPAIVEQTVVGMGCTVDKAALDLKPPDVPATLFPVQTGADGNCLPRCLSRFAYGKESFHLEMRCRITIEMVKNKEQYIRGVGMNKEGEDPKAIACWVAALAEGSGHTPDNMTEEAITAAFEKEAMEIRHKGVNMGIWQLAAAANVLGAHVHSFYPAKGWPVYVRLSNWTLIPSTQTSMSSCNILWTSTREDMDEHHWTANHFVPLLPLSTPNATVSVEKEDGCRFYGNYAIDNIHVNEYFFVNWNGEDYVAKVEHIFASYQYISILFMECENGLFFFPTDADDSLESVGVLRERVNLDFVAEASTQRRQYFKISYN